MTDTPHTAADEAAERLRQAGHRVIEPSPRQRLDPARIPSLQRELREIRGNAIEAEAAADSQAIGLDVERLAEAMAATGYEAHDAYIVQWAGEIAAEYARSLLADLAEQPQ